MADVINDRVNITRGPVPELTGHTNATVPEFNDGVMAMRLTGATPSLPDIAVTTAAWRDGTDLAMSAGVPNPAGEAVVTPVNMSMGGKNLTGALCTITIIDSVLSCS